MKSGRAKKRSQCATRKADELGRPPFSGFPADVWSVILSYTHDDPQVWSGDECYYRPGPPSGYWLLCRSLYEGLNLWIWSALSDEVKRTNGVLSLPHQWTRYMRKRAALALSHAPKEFLQSVRHLDGNVDELYNCTSLMEMNNLTSMSGPFLKCSIPCWSLQRVDLRHLTSLKELGIDFLSYSGVEDVALPDCLEQIGDRFGCGSRIRMLDLSTTRITRVGGSFLKGARLISIKFPATLRRIGDSFLCYCSIRPPPSSDLQEALAADQTGLQVDLAETALETVGDHFLFGSKVGCVLLPRSLKSVGAFFMSKYTGKQLDLSMTALKTVGNEFLSQSMVENLLTPASLEFIGFFFLKQFQGRRLDLSHTALEHLPHGFLVESNVEELLLPPTVKTADSTGFLDKVCGTRLDLSRTVLEESRGCFLNESSPTPSSSEECGSSD